MWEELSTSVPPPGHMALLTRSSCFRTEKLASAAAWEGAEECYAAPPPACTASLISPSPSLTGLPAQNKEDSSVSQGVWTGGETSKAAQEGGGKEADYSSACMALLLSSHRPEGAGVCHSGAFK